MQVCGCFWLARPFHSSEKIGWGNTLRVLPANLFHFNLLEEAVPHIFFAQPDRLGSQSYPMSSFQFSRYFFNSAMNLPASAPSMMR
jgi:hypothetical protein